MTCARQWQTTFDELTMLHECKRSANHAGGCSCGCGAHLQSCARLPSSGTGPGEVPTRKPSEILADRKRLRGQMHYPECPKATDPMGGCVCDVLARA